MPRLKGVASLRLGGFDCFPTCVAHPNIMFQTFPFNISYLRYIFWVVSSEGNNILGALLLLPKDEGEHVGSGTLPALPPRTTLDLGGGGLRSGLWGHMAVIATTRSLS